MALPDLKMPTGTPFFLAAGHAIELRDQYGGFAAKTGASRKRRLFTATPRIQSVSLFLERDEMTAVHNWFEGDCDAGALPFSAYVMQEGGVPAWWEAMWLEPYTTSALPRGRFRLNGRLLLNGDPSLDGPGRSSFVGRITIPIEGAAFALVGRPFSGRITIPIGGSVPVEHSRALAGRIEVPIA